MRRFIRWILVSGCIAFYFFVFRPRMNSWGTKGSEADDDLQGDWILGDKLRATQAATLLRSPEEVWRWIAQMGRGAGYYAWDYVLNGNRTSADYLLPDLPPPSEGDRNRLLGKVECVEQGSAITWIWHSREYPLIALDYRLTYSLKPLGLGACRLIVRSTIDWHGRLGFIFSLFCEPVCFVFLSSQLQKIKHLSESYEARSDSERTNRHLAGQHQADPVQFAAKTG